MAGGPPQPPERGVRLWRYQFVVGLIWTGAVAASLAWNLHQAHHAFLELAAVEARATFEKDLLYRRWNARQGGVYVPVSDFTPPNPWLEGMPGRDLTTSDGRHLTMVNPAYMTRQVHELAASEQGGVRGHITSLRPIRPQNAPDEWERGALRRLEAGATEVVEVADIDAQDSLRFMGRLLVEAQCLKCHGGLGYQVGEVRGGISVTVPLAPYMAVERAQALALSGWHALLWAAGLLGTLLGGRRLRQRVQEREAALRALHAAEAQLAASRRLEAVGQLAGGVAHDLNNALAPILSHANAALEEAPPGGELREDLAQVVGAATRARGIVRRLLAFSRRQPLEVVPLDLSEVVVTLLPMLRDVAGPAVKVEPSLGEGLPAVEGDRGQLETALVSLAANARDAMPRGGELHLVTSAEELAEDRARGRGLPSGRYVSLVVRDTGAGMSPDVQERVFEPFFTTKEVGKGSGLGLASVHGVVKGHGGAIEVISAPGKGTAFRLLLPAGPRGAARPYDPSAASASSAAEERSQLS